MKRGLLSPILADGSCHLNLSERPSTQLNKLGNGKLKSGYSSAPEAARLWPTRSGDKNEEMTQRQNETSSFSMRQLCPRRRNKPRVFPGRTPLKTGTGRVSLRVVNLTPFPGPRLVLWRGSDGNVSPQCPANSAGSRKGFCSESGLSREGNHVTSCRSASAHWKAS